MLNKDSFWQASLQELKSGFTQDKNYFICLLCGKTIEKGLIYCEDGVYYEAQKYMHIHIAREHVSVFDYLINLDKKVTGLSEHQNHLLKAFYQGQSDADIQSHLGIGSKSTIRNHRFMLKEKERQARVFLALMELLKEKTENVTVNAANGLNDKGHTHPGVKGKLLKKFFPQGVDGPLKTLDMKEKSKLAVLSEIARRFESGRDYNEKEVNAILEEAHEDFVTLRRYLIDYGFLEREADGSHYWLKDRSGELEQIMDRKKELKQQYREMKTDCGIYQIRNTINNKIFIASTPNFKTLSGKRGMLMDGRHYNRQLQEEWKQFGEAVFVFEVLENLEEKEEGFFDKRAELTRMEKEWLERLQPYEERGYHKRK